MAWLSEQLQAQSEVCSDVHFCLALVARLQVNVYVLFAPACPHSSDGVGLEIGFAAVAWDSFCQAAGSLLMLVWDWGTVCDPAGQSGLLAPETLHALMAWEILCHPAEPAGMLFFHPVCVAIFLCLSLT